MNALYIRLFFILLLLVLFFVKPEFESVTDPDLLGIYIFIFFTAIFIHLFSEWDNKNWFRLDVIFLLGYGIVHFQWPIMFLGFALASISLHAGGKGSFFVILAAPFFIAGIPIIDTLLAIWRRSIRKVLAHRDGNPGVKIMPWATALPGTPRIRSRTSRPAGRYGSSASRKWLPASSIWFCSMKSIIAAVITGFRGRRSPISSASKSRPGCI